MFRYHGVVRKGIQGGHEAGLTGNPDTSSLCMQCLNQGHAACSVFSLASHWTAPILIPRALLTRLWVAVPISLQQTQITPCIPLCRSSSPHHSFTSAQERLTMFPEKPSAALASGFVSEQRTLKGHSPLKDAQGDWTRGTFSPVTC